MAELCEDKLQGETKYPFTYKFIIDLVYICIQMQADFGYIPLQDQKYNSLTVK